jgi:PIN domain nuclease of toxin-antitoxin system
MTRALLDSSALLALINKESGSSVVADLVNDALMSAVNHCEIVSKLIGRGWPLDAVRQALGQFAIDIADFDHPHAEAAGAMIARTRDHGLSLGDRACLSLGEALGLPVYTSDQRWRSIKTTCPVHLIRP